MVANLQGLESLMLLCMCVCVPVLLFLFIFVFSEKLSIIQIESLIILLYFSQQTWHCNIEHKNMSI